MIVERVDFELFVRDGENFIKLSNDFCSFRIIQNKLPNHPDRCRFKTFMMFIDCKQALIYYVNNLKSGQISATDIFYFTRDFIVNEAAPTLLNAVDETRQFVSNDAVPAVTNAFNDARLFVLNVAISEIKNKANMVKDFIINDAADETKNFIMNEVVPGLRPNMKDVANVLIRVYTCY